MSKDRYRLGADIADSEALRDSRDRQVDDTYVREAVTEALTHVRGRGRPSLSESGQSPLLRVRISRELDEAVRKAAEQAGASRAEWVRKVLDDATHRASRRAAALGRSCSRDLLTELRAPPCT